MLGVTLPDRANDLSINAELVLHIHLEEISDRLPAHTIQHQKYSPTPNTLTFFTDKLGVPVLR